MSLSQVQFGVAITFGLVAGWSALIMAIALCLPKNAQRAETALAQQPKRCLWVGIVMMVIFFLALQAMGLPHPLIKFVGTICALSIGAVLTVGGAGIAHLMGTRIGEMSGARSSFGTLVRGSFVYSFAMLFPLIGWFVFAPVSAVFALGAGIIALRPERKTLQAPSIPSLPQGI